MHQILTVTGKSTSTDLRPRIKLAKHDCVFAVMPIYIYISLMSHDGLLAHQPGSGLELHEGQFTSNSFHKTLRRGDDHEGWRKIFKHTHLKTI
jgi:hypothetical protein